MRKPSAGSFEDRWLRRQKECGQDDLGSPDFLQCADAILPNEAAPFVAFKEGKEQPRIWEVFGPANAWSPKDKAAVAGYRMIGTDGCGNPICIEDETGLVCMLDHEDRFRTRQFVNSNVRLLAESLLACIGERDGARLRAAIANLDPPAAEEKTFWNEAAANLKSVEDAD